MEHLTPKGRAGIVVPEGIIFQSGKAYKSLRRMMVEKYLVGVISLPSGVFNPYSGVKTSILVLDRELSQKTDSIFFAKVEKDGYDLGAQRREIEKNDLPIFIEEISNYLNGLRNGKEVETERLNFVPKEKILASNDVGLSYDRYTEKGMINSSFPMVELKEVADIIAGQSPEGKYYNQVGIGLPFYQGRTDFGPLYLNQTDNFTEKVTKTARFGDIVISVRAPVGPVNLVPFEICIGRGLASIRPNNYINRIYLYYLLKHNQDKIKGNSGAIFDSINKTQIESIEIPLPPIEVQEEIVRELEQYQKIIDGAKQVVDNYKPVIDIDPSWEMKELGEVCVKITDGSHFSPPTQSEGFHYITVKDIKKGEIDFGGCERINQVEFEKLVKNGCSPQYNDVLFSKDGTVGKTYIVKVETHFVVLSSLAIITSNTKKIIPDFLYNLMSTEWFINKAIDNKTGVAIKRVVLKTLKSIKIPVPSLEIQQSIVERIEGEKQIIEGNKKLIEIYTQKIQDRINKIWGN
jgi:type I restriction enzyme M protein